MYALGLMMLRSVNHAGWTTCWARIGLSMMDGFFDNSEFLDHLVLRPLAHIQPAWELTWSPEAEAYAEESDSFAALLNALIRELAVIEPPARYHDSEDRLAEFVRDGQARLT